MTALPHSADAAEVGITLEAGRIEGRCAPAFAPVLDAFRRNFEAHGEVGASVAIVRDGETVVDLWGGMADPAAGRAWTADTVVVVFSCTKAATAMAAHVLADKGRLDLDAPVASLWPEFAAAGKADVTTRMLLDHTAGLPALREKLKPDCLLDWDYMTERLAAEEPFWPPGAQTGYHAITFGYLVGEVVRRAGGRSLGQVFAEEVAGPLGLDFWIGLPEAAEARIAPVILYRPAKGEAETPFIAAARQRGSIANLFVFNHGDWMAGGVNTRAGRAAEIGAAGGITNARGLAGMFQGALPSGGLGLSAETRARMALASSATHMDQTLRQPMRFGQGFMLSTDNRRAPHGGDSVVMGRDAFGHVGAGGSIGFADPEAGIAFGYAMNRQGPGVLLNPRGQGLVDAAYQSLGYRSDVAGVWLR